MTWVSGRPEEYLGQGQRCLCLCELVCGHACFYRVVIQEGLCQAQMKIPQIEWLNGDKTIGDPYAWST